MSKCPNCGAELLDRRSRCVSAGFFIVASRGRRYVCGTGVWKNGFVEEGVDCVCNQRDQSQTRVEELEAALDKHFLPDEGEKP